VQSRSEPAQGPLPAAVDQAAPPQAAGRAPAIHEPYRQAFKVSQRPTEVADRTVPGHWEGDLVLRTGGRSAAGVLVERATRFTVLLHLPGTHDADSVAEAMIAK
jgi:IS30 family transposase